MHKNWYNGRKSMYCFNNTVVIDHNGLIIYEDNGYPGKYHDVNILRHSQLYLNWRDHFTLNEDYFEYLLGDPGYVGEEMFIMRRIGERELHSDVDMSSVRLYNKMHAVEWGIGGLKRKWRRLMKTFDATKERFPIMFTAGCIMTNFIHRREMDFTFDLLGQRDNQDAGWEGDF
ncbi:hypothetical protein AC1031_008828 [Aphanomyces cochlioides]|nr:hypothetical protein AC1031_008828 [Aphanomyces cochlioides]